MKNGVFIFLFFLCGIVFSQDLENDIYNATEAFNNNPNGESLSILNENIKDFNSKISTKDEHFAFINLLINKAYYLAKSNHQKEAIETYEIAWLSYKNNEISKVFEYDIIEYCLKPLGVLYNKIGNYTNAENIIKQYIFLAEKQNNDHQRVAGAINLTRLYQTLGKQNLALETANKGLKIKNINPNKRRQLERLKNLSLVALDKKTAFNYSNDIVLPPGHLLFDKYEIEYELAKKDKDYKTALELFNRLKLYRNNKLLSSRTKAKLSVEEAQLYYLLNDKEKANKQLMNALTYLLPNFDYKDLPKQEELYPENTFIDVFDLLAKLQSNPESALKSYDLSFYVSSLLEYDITSQEAKLINLSSNRERSEKCISLLYDLSLLSDNATTTERAFLYSEKNKASILKEIIGKKSLLELHPEDSLLIKEQDLLKKQEQLTNQLIKTPYKSTSDSNVNELRSELNVVSIELKKLKIAIDTKYSKNQTNFPSFEKLKEKLKADQATLVEYFYGKQAIYQFILSNENIAFNKIELNKNTQKSIIDFIDFFNDAFVINNNISKYTTEAFELYKTLRFDELSTNGKVLIIPDGFLNFIPFEALITSKTEIIDYSKIPFVVKTQMLAYNSTASLYLRTTKPIKNKDLLGVFPVFKNTNQELAYSINEAESIEKEMNAKYLMFDLATKEGFLEYAPQYSVLHLSTHANSGDFTTPANIEFSNSTLYLNELYDLNINSDLVVLSACETGIGKLQKGEGAMSIARGFQYAGAKNVLFSLWQISDLSTSQIMKSFYKNYTNSNSAYFSNHQSKIDYLKDKNIQNSKKSPYYWSAFVFYGDLAKQEESYSTYITPIVICSLIILLLLFLFKRKNGKRFKRIST